MTKRLKRATAVLVVVSAGFSGCAQFSSGLHSPTGDSNSLEGTIISRVITEIANALGFRLTPAFGGTSTSAPPPRPI